MAEIPPLNGTKTHPLSPWRMTMMTDPSKATAEPAAPVTGERINLPAGWYFRCLDEMFPGNDIWDLYGPGLKTGMGRLIDGAAARAFAAALAPPPPARIVALVDAYGAAEYWSHQMENDSNARIACDALLEAIGRMGRGKPSGLVDRDVFTGLHVERLVREWFSTPHAASVDPLLVDGLIDVLRMRLSRAAPPPPPAGEPVEQPRPSPEAYEGLRTMELREEDRAAVPKEPDLRAAAEALLKACAEDFGFGDETDDSDRGAVALGDAGDSAVTFEHLRTLRDALTAEPHPDLRPDRLGGAS